MDEYQLEQYCDRHPLCDCNCVKCPGMGAYMRTELGHDDIDDNEDYEQEDIDKDYDTCD